MLDLICLWALLLEQKGVDSSDAGFLAPAATATIISRPGDILDAARNCLIELRWSLSDARERRPLTRRQWDFVLGDVLALMSPGPTKDKALRSLSSMYANPHRRQWRFLGELLSPAGTSLYTASSLFTHIPFWFIALESFLGVTSEARLLEPRWHVSSVLTDARPTSSAALEWAPSLRRDSQIFSAASGRSFLDRVRQLERLLYARREGITYESCSDGTLRRGTASFA